MLLRETRTRVPMSASAAPFKGAMAVRQTIERRVFLLACVALTLALGGCGVFCNGAGTNGWVGGACGTTVHF
ncbi:hypothetical protein [Burkholderia plantarii]|uniref:hypothetical protein n=1 Tax=Burkholderia plantarii TaxID=41899 RepID=UPI001F5B7BF1|nr:hypothetical protein [Burkholderia plantarii]